MAIDKANPYHNKERDQIHKFPVTTDDHFSFFGTHLLSPCPTCFRPHTTFLELGRKEAGIPTKYMERPLLNSLSLSSSNAGVHR
jgi:hypothetical protein